MIRHLLFYHPKAISSEEMNHLLDTSSNVYFRAFLIQSNKQE